VPGCAVHFELASRVLRAWDGRGADSPISSIDPDRRSAFLLGSLGPDLGYLPGGDALLADLAHCVRPADLARNLIISATTDVELAFAWGWATHVLADIWIHPIINEAVGELFHGRPLPGVPYADDPISHIRVEIGLDAALPACGNWPRPPKIRQSVIARGTDQIVTAYRDTYGFSPSLVRMKTVLRFAGLFTSLTLLNGAIVSGRSSGLLARCAFQGIAGLSRRFHPGGKLAAFTNPLLPESRLIHRVERLVEEFPESFRPHHASNLADLPNVNLDTGNLEGDTPDYPLTIAAIRELDRRTLSRK
jgi:Zinc dependent phospholipase C